MRHSFISFVAVLSVLILSIGSLQGKTEGPDLEALKQIKLPRNPSKQEAREYIQKILLVSRDQARHFPSDPQVAMLTDVGHQNLDEILIVGRGNLPWNVYVVEAAKVLAKEEDKAKIIAALRDFPPLVEVVIHKGWGRDAKPILVEKLRTTKGYLPVEFAQAVASFHDPATYDALIAYFIDGWNRHSTYKAIRNLPGIDLSKAIPQSWENARSDKYDLGYMTEPALAAGYLPALDFTIKALDDNNGVSPSFFNARALALRYTEALGSNGELQKWYMRNQNQIIFDKKRMKFIVRR